MSVDPARQSLHDVIVTFEIASGAVAKTVGKRSASLDLTGLKFWFTATLVQNEVRPEQLYSLDAQTARTVAALSGSQGAGAFTIECLFLNLTTLDIVSGFGLSVPSVEQSAQRFRHAGYAEKFLARPENIVALRQELEDQFALFMRDYFARDRTPDGNPVGRFLLNTTMRAHAPKVEPSLSINDLRFKVTRPPAHGAEAGPSSLDYLCTVVDGRPMPAHGGPIDNALSALGSWLTPDRVEGRQATAAGAMVLRSGRVARLLAEIFRKALPEQYDAMEQANQAAEAKLGRKVTKPEVEYPYPEHRLLLTETPVWDDTTGKVSIRSSPAQIHDEGGTSSLVRDARGIWQDEPITVADVGAATKLLTFQTVVAFKNDNGLPAAGRVRLSASVASTIVLNGHSHFVYPGNDAVLDIPADGKLTLSNRALSFSPATYRLKVDHWAQAIDINPASSLYQRFGTLTADDLRKASKADGQPLLGDAWRTGDEADSLDALVQSLKQAAQLATRKSGGADGIWLVNEGEIFSSRVAAASLPDGYSWGLASDGAGGLQPIDQTTANRLASQAGRTSSGLFGTGVSLSDTWEMIANAATDAVRFVVRKATDVIEFICEIGGRVGRFILNTLEEIGSFFKWLWASIKTAAEDVWDFLKFLFDWDDIIAVRNSVRDGFEDQLKALRKDVQGLRPIVAGFFDDGIRKVQDIKHSHGFPVSRPVGEQEIAAARKQGADDQDAAVNSGPGSWIMEQFGNVMKAFIDIELPDMPDTGPGMMDVFNRQLDSLSNMGSDIGGAIRSIFPDGNPSILDLSFEKIKEVVAAVGLNIAESALTMGKDLCLAMIDTLAALLDAFRAVMFARIRSPLIEKLWELISGEKKDLSFSIIDLVLLPPAVMGTILFKLIFPKVDIQAVARVRLPTDDVVAVQSDGLFSIAAVLKDVVSSCISFYSVMSGALSAAASVVKQKAIGKVKWVFWTLGMLAHLATPLYGAYKLVRDRKRIPSRMSLKLDTLAWFVVLAQHSVKYTLYTLPEGMEEAAYAASHKGLALGELGCNIVNLLLRSLAIAYAEEGEYPALPMVQFYCTTVGKALNAGAHLISHPKAKAALVVGAAGSGIGALVVAACHFRKAHLPVVQEAIAAL
ncbi:hypothetical protein [Burkholderia glumae]